MKTLCLIILVCVPLVLCLGCSDNARVSGVVKLPDGSTLTKGTVIFENDTINVIGLIDKQGRYSLFQVQLGDGVPPGNYRGYVRYPSEKPTTGKDGEILEPAVHFSAKYTRPDTAELNLTVERGKPVVMDIVLE